MSDKKLCVTCETVAEPVHPPARWGNALATIAAAIAGAFFLRDRGLWWLPLLLAVPSLPLFARGEAAHCPACGAATLIPLHTPVAQARLRAAEERADAALRAPD